MKISILTLFPDLFSPFFQESMIGIASDKNIFEKEIINIRDFTHDRHNKVDDYPYGGGPGMVMKPDPIWEALESIENIKNIPVIYFTPQGRLLTQDVIKEFCSCDHLVLLCGHYKEIDQRVRDHLVTEELSIGDYVLSGGELPAMVFMDAIIRLQEGVLGDIESAKTDSHEQKLLGCPHYTRPPEYRGLKVPDVLLSGNHKKIDEWRLEKSLEITKKVRPDLFKEYQEMNDE